MFAGFAISFVTPMYIDGPMDCDSAKPKEDASVMMGEGFNLFQRGSERLFQHIFREFRTR